MKLGLFMGSYQCLHEIVACYPCDVLSQAKGQDKRQSTTQHTRFEHHLRLSESECLERS